MEAPPEHRMVEHWIPKDILDDILTRFIICIPQSSKDSMIRICFQVELAYWFYLDFYVKDNGYNLPNCTIYEFAAHVFEHVPFLQSQRVNLPQILADWKHYKQSVPTYGAIILSEGMTHVLLVQSYFAKSSWGFPKGKVNEEENPMHCARREVLEETGFDIGSRMNKDEFFEHVINDQLVGLYIVKDVPMTTKFEPRTRCEIKACQWFAVADLPVSKKDCTPKVKVGVSANAFFMVMPFVRRLKNYCNGGGLGKRMRHQSGRSNSNSEDDHHNTKVYTNNNNNNNNSKTKPNRKHEQEDRKGGGHHHNQQAAKKSEKKQNTKRQLFGDDRTPFSAPSWLNFKFNREALMECLP